MLRFGNERDRLKPVNARNLTPSRVRHGRTQKPLEEGFGDFAEDLRSRRLRGSHDERSTRVASFADLRD